MRFELIGESDRRTYSVKCNHYVPRGSIVAVNSRLYVVIRKVLVSGSLWLGHLRSNDFFRPNYHSTQFGSVCTYDRQREVATCWDDDGRLVDFAPSKRLAIELLRQRYTEQFLKRAEAVINE